jgi:hypothetical protein
MRISNRPTFYDAGTPPSKGARRSGFEEEGRTNGDGDDYHDQYQYEDRGPGDVESHYHNLYEQRMNPFDQVRGVEWSGVDCAAVVSYRTLSYPVKCGGEPPSPILCDAFVYSRFMNNIYVCL